MARKKYRSRLARKESQRLMRQSLLFIFLTAAALVALVVWGVPTLVRLATFLGEIQSADQPIEQEDTIAPYTPQLAIPYDATSSAFIDIHGYAEAGSEISLYLDGNKISEEVTNDSGEFSFNQVELAEGENIFSVMAVDGAGNESELSGERRVLFDDTDPKVEISSPDMENENITSEEKVFMVEGKSEPGAKIYVNDRLARVDNEGNFSGQASLNEGENEVKVRAVDKANNQTEVMFKVSYYE